MKKMRRIVSFVLAMVMVMGMSMTAMAATTYSIKINNSEEGHTYEAYQIFAGDYAELNKDGSAEQERVLSNIVWGNGVTDAGKTEMGDAATKAKELDGMLKDSAEAKAFAQKIEEYLFNPAGSANSITINGEDKYYEINNLAAGYYLIKDKDTTQDKEITAGDQKEAYTYYILEVVDDVDVTVKESVPSVTKKVYDTNDTSTAAVTDITTITDENWIDSADYDIGDNVPFRLQATLGSNITGYYGTYKVVFHDTLPAGLDYKNDAKVMLDTKDITNLFTISETTGTLTISCDNVLETTVGATNNSIITVYYTATLNTNAVTGTTGNASEVYLEYSSNPNGTNSTTGTTPVDKVQVFTYEVVINKVKDNGTTALTGAQFKLEKKDQTGAWAVAKTATVSANGTVFTFKGLDDGDYKLTETTTPAGYNTITPIEFTIAATHDEDANNPTVTALSGTDAETDTTKKVTFAADEYFSTLSATVVNKKGVVLPSTGGMGTTIFYIAGGIMVAVAGVLLITRKRMNAQEK